jgi:hypothetical protein
MQPKLVSTWLNTTLRSSWVWLKHFALCLLFSLWFSGLMLSFPQTSWAEDLPTEVTPPAIENLPFRTSLNASDVSSEKINQFVKAYLKVLALIDRHEGELQSAETQSESLRVQQEIETEAFTMIEAEGLTGQEYLQLLGLANTDPEFGERITTQLQEAANK